MKKKCNYVEIGLWCILLIVCYLAYRYILYDYLLRTIFFSYSHIIYVHVIAIFILTYLSRVCLFIIQYKYIKHIHVFYLKWIYFIVLIYILFFKTIGLQGYELDPLSFLWEIQNGSISYPVMNILCFIPIGFMIKQMKKQWIYIILGLLLIETVQYTGHLGIFDFGDCITNFIGILIGYGFSQLKIYQTITSNYIR
ncbi:MULTISPECIES: VanZ family protein [unclassified Granulicatella]|uniref:VanZ family protein n=1 Tax=unclassified Granulicatella TaxID=2630493 RepID=UPI0014319035|nr:MULTISPECIES: VanZ family protein [unclassified Granulicatella]MBF0779720.1 VanZ family protein [Granulicatella sp. 19428wC4_WM01]